MAGGLALTAIGKATNREPAASPVAKHAPAQVSLARIPLAFEANRGQADKRVFFTARGRDYALFLTERGSVLTLDRGKHSSVVRTRIEGAAPGTPAGEARLPGVVNVYRGTRAWTAIPTFAGVRYGHVYPGVDLVFHGRQGLLEYDFNVRPGADPAKIRLAITGSRGLRLARNGDLLVPVAGGVLRQRRPVAYQQIGGRRVAVPVGYALDGDHVTFRVGRYDGTRALLIDPVLGYSSYLGGGADDQGQGIAIAPDGGPTLVGTTKSNNFPGATARTNSRTDEDVFVTHLNSAGSAIVYSTYIGGAGNTSDEGNDVAIDGGGGAFVVGTTSSTDYPQVVPLPGDQIDVCSDGGSSAFITKLFGNGTIAYSSCFGGNSSDTAYGIVLRSVSGASRRTEAYITGATSSSSSFPTTGGYQTAATASGDAFLVKVNFSGTLTCDSGGLAPPCDTISYGTYFGGDGGEQAKDVTVDSSGNAFIVGTSNSSSLGGVGSPSAGGFGHAFVAKFNSTGSAPTYTTWFSTATSSENMGGIAIDSAGNAYIAGESDGTLPGQQVLTWYGAGGQEAFIGVLNSSGGVSRTIYVGGTGNDAFNDLALQENGGTVGVVAVGQTLSTKTAVNGLAGQSCNAPNKQAFVAKFTPTSTPTAIYITCLGGDSVFGDYATSVAMGSSGTVWLGGWTDTGAVPTVAPYQGSHAGGTYDGFLARIDQKVPSIDSGPSGVIGTGSATFTYSTDDTGMTFACSPEAAGVLGGTPSGAACTGAGTTTYTGLADGPNTFQVATVDASGSPSAPASRTFTVDTTPPGGFNLSAPDDNAAAPPQPTFSWTQASDATAITYGIQIDGKKVQDVPDSACSGGTCSAQAASPIRGGQHSWNVVAVDAGGNATPSTGTRTIQIVDPPTAAFSIAPNPVLAGRSVTFDGSLSKPASNPIVRYEWDLDGDGSFETDGAGTPTTAKTYDTPGTVKVGLRVTDSAGFTSTSTQDLRVSAPIIAGTQVGVTVNDGAQYTNHPDVTLTVVAPPGITSILVSNDGGFMNATTVTPAKASAAATSTGQKIPWKLDSSGPERLPKTVYVRFLTATFASPNYTDDIILDERPPVVSSASVVGGPAGAAAQAARLHPWKLKVKASDTNSGVGSVQATSNKRKPGKLTAYKTRLTVKLGSRPRFLRARDRAGNYSAWKKLG